jgi:hypothetical protein
LQINFLRIFSRFIRVDVIGSFGEMFKVFALVSIGRKLDKGKVVFVFGCRSNRNFRFRLASAANSPDFAKPSAARRSI